jgi:hypothetical protein
MTLMLGLTVGGLLAANSLGITFAKTAYGAAQGVGRGFGGYVGRQGKKAGRAVLQQPRMEKITQRLQTSRIPGVSAVGRGIAGLTAKGGKELVERTLPEARGKNSDQLALELSGSMGSEKRFAYLSELQRRGDLDKIKTVGGKTLDKFRKDNDKLFRDYGQGKLAHDLDVATGKTNPMREAEEALREKGRDAEVADKENILGGGAGEMVKAAELLEAASRKFVEGLSRADINNMQLNNIFRTDAPAQLKTALTKAFLTAAPHLVPAMLPKMKAQQLKEFETSYRLSISQERGRAKTLPAGPQQDNLLARLSEIEKNFNQSIANNALGLIPETSGATAAPVAPPPPAPERKTT